MTSAGLRCFAMLFNSIPLHEWCHQTWKNAKNQKKKNRNPSTKKTTRNPTPTNGNPTEASWRPSAAARWCPAADPNTSAAVQQSWAPTLGGWALGGKSELILEQKSISGCSLRNAIIAYYSRKNQAKQKSTCSWWFIRTRSLFMSARPGRRCKASHGSKRSGRPGIPSTPVKTRTAKPSDSRLQ